MIFQEKESRSRLKLYKEKIEVSLIYQKSLWKATLQNLLTFCQLFICKDTEKKNPIYSKIDNLPMKTVLHSKFMFHQWGDNYNYLHGIFTPFSAQTKGHVTRRSRLVSTGNSGKQLYQGLSLSDTVLHQGCQCSLKHAVSALPWSIGFFLSISWILLGI